MGTRFMADFGTRSLASRGTCSGGSNIVAPVPTIPDDSCMWPNDGICDAPQYCVYNTDHSDCGAQVTPGILFVGDAGINEWCTDPEFPNSMNYGQQPGKFKQTCKKIWMKITAAGARVLYMGTKPEPDSQSLWKKYKKYDKKVSKLAATLQACAHRKGCAYSPTNKTVPPLVMIDVYKGFKDVGNNLDLYGSSAKGNKQRIHLSPKGYKLWSEWAHQAMDPQGERCYLW